MSKDEGKKKLADKLREVKRAIDILEWYECEVCYECLEKYELASLKGD